MRPSVASLHQISFALRFHTSFALQGIKQIALLAKALDMNDTENARQAYQLAMNAFERAMAGTDALDNRIKS